MDLRRYVFLARRWLWLIAVAGAVTGAAAYLVSVRQARLYRSSALMLVNQTAGAADVAPNVDVVASQGLAPTYATIATSWPVLSRAAQSLGRDPERQGIDATATVPVGTQLLQISVVDPSPRFAMDAANAVASVFVDTIKQARLLDTETVQSDLTAQLGSVQSGIQKTRGDIAAANNRGVAAGAGALSSQAEIATLQSQLSTQQNAYATLAGQLAQLKIAQARADSGVRLVAPAQLPRTPFSPRVRLNTAIAAGIGLLLGAGLATLLEYFDDRVQTPEDVQRATGGSATLSIVERLVGHDSGVGDSMLVELGHSGSRALEAYRHLRTNLQFATTDHPATSILITSARPNEGKTTTAANLAIVLAQIGRSVLLVDADFRRPSLHQVFGLPNAAGLSTLFLAPDVPPQSLASQTEFENLVVLTSGPQPPNPAELLGSLRMRPIIEILERTAEVVIFDSPPLLAVADASELAARVDGTILIVDTSKTRPRELTHARDSLSRGGALLLGVVLNKLQRGQTTRGNYYYNSYYSYGYQGGKSSDRRDDRTAFRQAAGKAGPPAPPSS